MDLGPGSEFAGYRIESVLGRGGMGVVYLAEHLGLGRKVALKVLAPDLAQDERFRERFVRESRLAASLEHPNVVPIHEAGEVDGVLFIAMRYVEGTDLRALLHEEGALEPQRAAAIVSQVAGALDAAHERGLVHRDVKPGNVLIAKAVGSSAGEHAYLTDFGLTKRTSSDSGLTGTGEFVGSLDYAAPEQFEGKPLDARTDVYSLGCLLYECLTGHPPFRRDNDATVMYAHLMEQAPTPSSVRPELPKAIDAVVARAMAKKPADRYESAGGFAADVRRALSSSEAAGTGGPARGPRPRTLIAAVAALGVVIVAIVVTVSLSGGGSESPGGATSPSSSVVVPPIGSVVEIDPATGTIASTVSGLTLDVGQSIILGAAGPASRPRMTVGEGGVWILDIGTVIHVDPETGTNERTPPYRGAGVLGYTRVIGTGLGDLVITDIGVTGAGIGHPGGNGGALTRIDPATYRMRRIEFPQTQEASDLAIGAGAIWESFGGGTLLQIDPRTFEVEHRFDLGGSIDAVAAGVDGVWVGDKLASTVRFVEARTGDVSEPIHVNTLDGLAADERSVWVLDRISGTVTQVDPTTGIGETVRVGDEPTDMVAGLGAIWVSDGGGAVWRVDPVTGEATSIEIGSPLAAIAIDREHGTVWALVFE